ncbi:MAG: efflux RND transporter periplasmic adaptor subunit [Raineya sp.]
MKKAKKTYWKWLWLLLPIGLVVVVSLKTKNKKENFFIVEYKEMTEAVYASGSILPKDEYKVFAMADGTLSKKMVHEGDSVKSGQILLLINNQQQQIRLQNAQEAYQIAQKNYDYTQSPVLKELQTAIRVAQTQMQNDSVNYVRFKNLWQENATSKIEYDKYTLIYENSKNNYLLQKARYEKAKNDLLLNLQNTQSQLLLNSEINQDYAVRSLLNGKVYEIYKEEGEAVRRGEVIALLGSYQQFYLQMSIDETDIDKIKVGQEVLVKVDIHKDKIFRAKVSKIYPRLSRQNQSFRVDAELDKEQALEGFSGLTAEANIIIQSKAKALVIPKAYLLENDSLWIEKEGEKQKIAIKKGIENFEWVEIIKGLENNTKVLKP